MNKASAEMRHCLNIPGIATEIEGMDISVLEKQRIAPKWQQHLLQVQPQYQQDNSSFNEASIQSLIPAQTQTFQGLGVGCGPCLLPPSPNLEELLNEPIKTDPGVHSRWIDFNEPSIQSARQLNSLGYGLNHAISRTASCPPLVAAAATAAQGTGRQPLTLDQKLSGATGRENFKKRKAEKSLPPKQGNTEEGNRSKKSKGCAEEDESKITEHISNRKGHSSQSNRRESGSNNNEKKYKEALGSMSKDNSKASEPNQPDYVHVRARRGQATDSHSLAERVRREKISERMKHLQDLVPGCNKITGKAGMLDEIINYVESLQRQVEFLSMKLAAVNPKLDFSIEDLIDKQAFATCSISMPTMGISPDCLQYNPIKQDLVYASELAVSQLDMGLRRAISAPISMPETFFDPSSFNQISGSLPWDANLQNIYAMGCQQGRSIPSQLPTFTGTIEANSLKMGM